jgi:hypothetical protein
VEDEGTWCAIAFEKSSQQAHRYSPSEILFTLTEKFEPKARINKGTMAYFFHTSAAQLIDAKRLDGVSESKPAWLATNPPNPGLEWRPNYPQWEHAWLNYDEFFSKWNAVLEAYKQAIPESAHEENTVEAGPANP